MRDFDELVRRCRRELHLHCYRMLGSFDEADYHVQEVFLRAWRSRECFQGRSSPRTWLYRVATTYDWPSPLRSGSGTAARTWATRSAVA